jgi:hypothetical protein
VSTVAAVMDQYVDDPLNSIDDLLMNDLTARRLAHGILQQ